MTDRDPGRMQEAREALHRAGVTTKDGRSALEMTDEETLAALSAALRALQKFYESLQPVIEEAAAAIVRFGRAFQQAVDAERRRQSTE